MEKTDIEKIKYKYALLVWGGFYNEEHLRRHQETEGYYYFDTKEEREEYLNKLISISKKINVEYLTYEKNEGYCCRKIPVVHRVIKFKGNEYYTSASMLHGCSYDQAKYYLECKWRLGFNDYPLGYDFDYDSGGIEIVQEWITGAFTVK